MKSCHWPTTAPLWSCHVTIKLQLLTNATFGIIATELEDLLEITDGRKKKNKTLLKRIQCFSVNFAPKPAAKRIKTLFFLMTVWSTKKEIGVCPDFLLCLFISLEQKESQRLAAHFLKSETNNLHLLQMVSRRQSSDITESTIWSSGKDRWDTSPSHL